MKKKKEGVFTSDFDFDFTGINEQIWKIDRFVKNKAKGQVSRNLSNKGKRCYLSHFSTYDFLKCSPKP